MKKESLILVLLLTILSSSYIAQTSKLYKVVLVNEKNNEKIGLLKCNLYLFSNGYCISTKSVVSDKNGLIIIVENTILDSLVLNIDPPYQYCSFQQSTQQRILLKDLSNTDFIYAKVQFFESELIDSRVFNFQPYSVNCTNEFNSEIEIEKPCYCLYNKSCGYLSPLLEMLTCNQNLVVDIEGNCIEDEYKLLKDSLINKRIKLIKQILVLNNVNPERIFVSSLGMSKPKVDNAEIKKVKPKEGQTNLYNINTYVRVKVRRR